MLASAAPRTCEWVLSSHGDDQPAKLPWGRAAMLPRELAQQHDFVMADKVQKRPLLLHFCGTRGPQVSLS